jgi:hypothetical protein
MYRAAFMLALFVLFLVGCGNSTESFQGQIDQVRANSFIIDCSNAVNKGEKGVINTMGYGCPVNYTNETVFRAENGASLNASDFSLGSTVKVILAKPINIRRNIEKDKPSALYAKEIVLLTREEVASIEVIIKALERQGLTVTKGEVNPSSKFQVEERGIEQQVFYTVNGEQLLIYHFYFYSNTEKTWIRKRP